MEALKFVAVLLLLVVVQVFGALGLSSEEEDGEVWMVDNWQVKKKKRRRIKNKQRTIFEGRS